MGLPKVDFAQCFNDLATRFEKCGKARGAESFRTDGEQRCTHTPPDTHNMTVFLLEFENLPVRGHLVGFA